MGVLRNVFNWITTDGSGQPVPEIVGRNEPCPCGSSRKYKKCCRDRDERSLEKLRAASSCGTR